MTDRPQFIELSAQMAPPSILLPPEPPDAVAALDAALAAGHEGSAERLAALKNVARRWPSFVDAWAHLAEAALPLGQDVESYAFARTAYHRSLDRLRANGWRGAGPIPWSHEPNRGVLRALHALMLTSERLGDTAEGTRLRTFLLDSDSTDPLGVRRD